MEAFLVIALIVSNIGWLIYMGRRDTLELEERKELHNRIAEPSLIAPPKEMVKAKLEAVKSVAKDSPPELFPDPDMSEIAAVGRVNPIVDRPEDN